MQDTDRARRFGRRKLLKGVGAGALATSAVVFGAPGTANAANYACCSLVFAPSSYSACAGASKKYIWTCRWTSTTGCSCCEKGTSPNYTASAYRCERV
ncbi:hypothetical protein [Paractinoplanes hotanensis]|uniref:Twin-arginine translocation signal domain-containing protein n=1 Tax=Paractinoplanes hotanensis TaxID=2906497 RepID=A0ABT0Y4G0_9ACTN|nr:hypothetical protein [Actinoplanes hotanensis]MCM4080892.1 hypothetical protein [Actinoplanes hotanensis]